jgi:hypothetical protein
MALKVINVAIKVHNTQPPLNESHVASDMLPVLMKGGCGCIVTMRDVACMRWQQV